MRSMMNDRLPLDLRAILILVTLSLTWGFQQVALKATAADMSPMMLVALRSGIAALLVAVLMRVQGQPLGLRDGSLRAGLLVGFLFALEFLLVAEGLRRSSAAHVVVFLYTAPIFAALGLHRAFPAERLKPLQWLGIGFAFGGIALAFLGGSTDGRQSHAGDAMALAAGASWGATTVTIRCSRLANAPAAKTLLYQLAVACVLLLAAALLLGQSSFQLTHLVLVNLAFQSVLVSCLSFLAWFWLLRRYLASQMGVFSFMTPLFGVALGAWLLHEPLEPGFTGGALLVLAGIVLVSGHLMFGRLLRKLARA